MKYLNFFIFNLVLFGQVGMAQEFNDNDFVAKVKPRCDDDEVAVYGTSSDGKEQAVVAAEKAAAHKPSSPGLPSQQWTDFCVSQGKKPNDTVPPTTDERNINVVESDDVGTTVRICVKFTCK